MPQFLTELAITRTVGVKPIVYTLAEDLVYVSDIFGTIVVPAGFKTDFASVPRLPLIYLLFGNVTQGPAVIHDYLYSHLTTKTAKYTQKTADKVFLEAMLHIGVPVWQGYVMYWAVRMFGQLHMKLTAR
jgi:hypothetical protein